MSPVDKLHVRTAIKQKLLVIAASENNDAPPVAPETALQQPAVVAAVATQPNGVMARRLFDAFGYNEATNHNESVIEATAVVPPNINLLVDAELTLWGNEPLFQRIQLDADGKVTVHNPLDWWKVNENRFPRLAVLARRILCAQATSAPSERLFSAAGLTVAKDRASLLPDNAAMLVFLHENVELVQNWRRNKGLAPLMY